MIQKHLLLFAPAAFLLAPPASAQIFDPFSTDYFTKVTWNDINRRTSETLRDAQRRKAASGKTAPRQAAPRPAPRKTAPRQATATPKAAAAPAASLSFRPAGPLAQSRGIEALVSRQRPDQQSTARANYVTLITSFNDTVPRLYGVQKNNMATGVAALLSGAYVAYHNRPFPDAWVKPLVTQLEASMAGDPALANAPAADKETAYHIMVGAGMALQVAQLELAKKPDARAAAGLKKMGADIFRQLLIENPDQVEFSGTGMSLR